MTAADLAFIASQAVEVLGYIALIFTPGLLVAAGFHRMRRHQARSAWAATTRATVDEYAQDGPLLDAAAHIVDAYADHIAPLYGKGE